MLSTLVENDNLKLPIVTGALQYLDRRIALAENDLNENVSSLVVFGYNQNAEGTNKPISFDQLSGQGVNFAPVGPINIKELKTGEKENFISETVFEYNNTSHNAWNLLINGSNLEAGIIVSNDRFTQKNKKQDKKLAGNLNFVGEISKSECIQDLEIVECINKDFKSKKSILGSVRFIGRVPHNWE